MIQGHPWLLAVIFFFASALLYSQAATAKALMPMALALNVSPLTAVASFFQAEDGIRDLRMSRGLGDVYKRQK
ncbi:hypothetical protein JMUB7526_28570 [Staphylococcus aureus]